MLQLGVRVVPILAHGQRYVAAKNLDEVAKFLGLSGSGHTVLPPTELVSKWLRVLHAARRYVRQMPNDQINANALPNRARSIRTLEHHVFNIVDGHLRCAAGLEPNFYLSDAYNTPPEDNTVDTADKMAAFGDEVIARLEAWWAQLDDKAWRRQVETQDYGVLSIHQLLERSTWHTAHHTRQIIDVLERLGIRPNGKLTESDLAGLPLPKNIWD